MRKKVLYSIEFNLMSHRKKVIKEDPTLFLLSEVALFPTLFVAILFSILATQRKERLIDITAGSHYACVS
jgi:hypothetical protein